jgi:hypothetical protein
MKHVDRIPLTLEELQPPSFAPVRRRQAYLVGIVGRVDEVLNGVITELVGEDTLHSQCQLRITTPSGGFRKLNLQAYGYPFVDEVLQ